MTTTTTLFTREGQPFTGTPTTNDRGQVGYFPGWRVCHRCGGAGGADKWKFTGWTCLECGGNGKLISERFIRLYDADRLAKLNAAKAVADTKRAEKAAAKAAAEAARVAAERDSIIAAHADILARIDALGNVSDFLTDMAKQVREKARPLSERQLEAATNACTKIEAENARRAAAGHVGTVGERVTLDLTYVRSIDLTKSRFDPTFIIWTFRTDDGNTVIFKGGDPKAFEGLYEWHKPEGNEPGYYRTVKGRKLALKVTIKAHDHNRKTGEPETVIQRPAVVAG